MPLPTMFAPTSLAAVARVTAMAWRAQGSPRSSVSKAQERKSIRQVFSLARTCGGMSPS